jgi:hypothetical protein
MLVLLFIHTDCRLVMVIYINGEEAVTGINSEAKILF